MAATALRQSLDDYVREQRRGRRIGDLRVSASNPEARVQEAAQAHSRRVAELRQRAAAVVAVDPGVRRLRRVIVQALAEQERVPLDELRSDDDAEDAIDHQLARLHLEAGRHSPPRPPARPAAQAPLATFPTGDRLVVELEDALVEVDIDKGQGRVIDGSDVYTMATVGRSVVYVDGSKAKVSTVGDPSRPRVLGNAHEVWSRHDGRSVWLVASEHEDDESSVVLTPVEVESGRPLAEAWAIEGAVVAATGRYVAVAHYSPRASRVEVWDAERRSVVRRVASGQVLDLVGTVMVWQALDPDAENTGAGLPRIPGLHVTDLVTGRTRTFTEPPGSGESFVIVSPDSSTLAVLSQSHISIVALADLHEVTSARLPGNRFPSAAAWSVDGHRLWMALDDNETRSTIAVFDVATGRLEQLPLEGEVYDVAAF